MHVEGVSVVTFMTWTLFNVLCMSLCFLTTVLYSIYNVLEMDKMMTTLYVCVCVCVCVCVYIHWGCTYISMASVSMYLSVCIFLCVFSLCVCVCVCVCV